MRFQGHALVIAFDHLAGQTVRRIGGQQAQVFGTQQHMDMFAHGEALAVGAQFMAFAFDLADDALRIDGFNVHAR